MVWVSEWAFDEVQEGGSNAVALQPEIRAWIGHHLMKADVGDLVTRQKILDARMRQRDETASIHHLLLSVKFRFINIWRDHLPYRPGF